MLALLEIELRKLVPSREFWSSMTAYVILMPGVFLSLKLLNFTVPGSTFRFDLFEFPEVWHNLAYVAQWVNYLLFVIVLQILTHEYQFRTIRQNIIDGLSPWQYLWGKVALLVVFTLGSTLLVVVLGLLGGFLMSGTPDRSQVFGKIEYVDLYCLQLLGYLTLAMLIGTLVRRTGMAILVFAGYTLAVEPLLRGFLLPTAVGRYLPSHVLGGLIPNPFFGYLGMGAPAPVDPGTVVVSGVNVVVFVLATGWVIARQDL